MALAPRKRTNQQLCQQQPAEGLARLQDFDSWEDLYRSSDLEELPWYHPVLDSDVERALVSQGVASGHVLDIGCGPGTQAMGLAERGFTVIASDVSKTAVVQASCVARARGLSIEFVHDDILSSCLAGPFDVVLDRGCFHVIAPSDWRTYREAVRWLVRPGGLFLLKTFSHLEPSDVGPYRFAPVEIGELFADDFEILSIEATVFEGTQNPLPLALFSVLQRPVA